jgi:hypothetical protein
MSVQNNNSWDVMDTATRWRLAAAILLAVAAFASMLNNGFVFDDIEQIVKNHAIQSWRFLPEYFSRQVWEGVFPGGPGTYYRPMFLVWLRLNDSLFGVNALGWHISSLLLHIYTTLLVFYLSRRWMLNARLASYTAMLFAVHPIHAEPVA